MSAAPSSNAPAAPARQRWAILVSWVLMLVWGLSALFVAAAPTNPLALALSPVMGLALLAFVLLHASLAYGWRGAGSMVVSAFLIALALESLSIATGFPFGLFEHTDEFGAKIGTVPVAVALGYFLYGYPAWMLARLIVGSRGPAWSVPAIAAFVVTQFDLTHDPVGATANGFWHFAQVSGINGVPLSNFLGWLVTSGAIFTTWALFTGRFDRTPPKGSPGIWGLPIAMWMLTALQYPLMWMGASDSTVTAGKAVIPVSDIFETATINALLVMGFIALLATVRMITANKQDD